MVMKRSWLWVLGCAVPLVGLLILPGLGIGVGQVLLVLLVLLCPLMHFLGMHRGHQGHGGGGERSEGAPGGDRPPGP